MTYGYIRVSSDKQTVENQRLTIVISADWFIELFFITVLTSFISSSVLLCADVAYKAFLKRLLS